MVTHNITVRFYQAHMVTNRLAPGAIYECSCGWTGEWFATDEWEGSLVNARIQVNKAKEHATKESR